MKPLTLSRRERTFLEKLQTLDFGPIAFKLMHPDEGRGWKIEQVTRAIEQYRRFLFLNYLYPNQQIVPTQEIDRVWHAHILDTEKYRQDCELLFGHFLHHYPYFGIRDEADRQQLEQAFSQTQELFKSYFGQTK